MRLLSQIFQPLITIPKNAKIKSTEITCKSQKLLVECGLIRPTSSGLFAILPLARRALDKIETLIRCEMESAGAQRVTLPALTLSSLWKSTGRLEDAAPHLYTLRDRHDKEYLLAPTHEEAVADLLADVGPLSYKQLPLLLYQITNKYRDEHRPKHGLLRAREFTMLDAYGVHSGRDCAVTTYRRVTRAYRTIFRTLGLTVHRVSAPSGEMGGSVSHEWQLPAAVGEDQLSVCDSRCGRAVLGTSTGCCECGRPMTTVSSVEVGHTFLLGARYSAPLAAMFTPAGGAPPAPVYMSSFGVGVTRLLAACVDVMTHGDAIRWPTSVAPYSAIIIGPKEGSREWSCHGWEAVCRVHGRVSGVPGLHDDVLIDDRHALTIGKRLLHADRVGYPYIIICGKATLESPPRYELHLTSQRVSEPLILTLDEIIAHLELMMKRDHLHDDSDSVHDDDLVIGDE